MKIFWLVYEVILLLCEAVFILRLRAVLGVFAKIKKSYAFAPEKVTYGHRQQKTRAEISPALQRCRTELLCWAAVVAVTGYAVFDCLIFNIMR